MHTIELGSKIYKAPSEWNEISQEQLLIWMQICAKPMAEENALRLATVKFYGIPEKDFFSLSRPQELQLLFTLSYLLDARPKLTKWVIPTIGNRLAGRRYHGPSNRLSSSTIREYRYAEMLHGAYQLKQDPAILDQLIAVLYRTVDSRLEGNDIRVPLTDLGIRERAKKIKGLAPNLKAAILFNYQCCRNYVADRFPTIFLSGDGKASKALPDLQGMIKNVAGGKFGNFVETEATGLYLFLEHLSDELAENERSKK